MFITFEGTEGSGKTTIINFLKEIFLSNGLDVLVTREPGGDRISEKIREILLSRDNVDICPITEVLLFAASRSQHYAQVIKKALYAQKIVLCDRFIDSSIVYQGIARGVNVDQIIAINEIAIGGKKNLPDFVFVLNSRPEIGMKRIFQKQGREVNRLDLEDLSFHQLIYQGYLDITKKNPSRYILINAEGTIEETLAEVVEVLKQKNILKNG
jgi:dTMP kinase